MDTKQATQTETGGNETGGNVRRRILTLVVVIVAMGASLTVGAQPSSAATQSYRSGSPGYYTVGNVQASVVYNADQAANYVALTVGGPSVWRSPTVGGNQVVIARTELWTYGTATGWRVLDARQQVATVSSVGVTFWPTVFNSLQGGNFYFVRQTIAWANGGAVQVDFNHQSDYRCAASGWVYNLCTTYSQGYIKAHTIGRNGVVYA